MPDAMRLATWCAETAHELQTRLDDLQPKLAPLLAQNSPGLLAPHLQQHGKAAAQWLAASPTRRTRLEAKAAKAGELNALLLAALVQVQQARLLLRHWNALEAACSPRSPAGWAASSVADCAWQFLLAPVWDPFDHPFPPVDPETQAAFAAVRAELLKGIPPAAVAPPPA